MLTSIESKDLISKMIHVCPKTRITLEMVLKHQWVNAGYPSIQVNYLPFRKPIDMQQISADIFQRLLAFGYRNEEALRALAESEANPIKNTYYLLNEMLQREESRRRTFAPPQGLALGANSSKGAHVSHLVRRDNRPTSSRYKVPFDPHAAIQRMHQQRLGQIMAGDVVKNALAARHRPLMFSPAGQTTQHFVAPDAQIMEVDLSSEAEDGLWQMQPRVNGLMLFEGPSNPVEGNRRDHCAYLQIASGKYKRRQQTSIQAGPSTREKSHHSSSHASTRSRRRSLPVQYDGSHETSGKQPGVMIDGLTSPNDAAQTTTPLTYLPGWFPLNVSTTSRKKPTDISAEILRVLSLSGLQYDQVNSYKILCEVTAAVDVVQQSTEGSTSGSETPSEVPETQSRRKGQSGIVFEIQIGKVPKMSLFGITFRRMHGNFWHYKKVCTGLLAQMNL